MKKKDKIISIVCTIIIVLSLFGYLTINYFLNKDIKKEQDKLDNIVYSDQIYINDFITEFNSKIIDNNLVTLSTNYTLDNDIYYYNLYEDITLYIKPIEYLEDQNKEIVYEVGIFYPKDTEYENMVIEYFKYLIIVNNSTIGNNLSLDLINKADNLSQQNKSLDENNGLIIKISKNDKYKEYQIKRLYK